MPERVRITDVSPRDGLQNEPGVIPTADKFVLVGLLAASGVDEVECTSFVSPAWVPQLADAPQLVRLINAAPASSGVLPADAPGPGAPEPGPGWMDYLTSTREHTCEFSVLVPNSQGMAAFLAANEAGPAGAMGARTPLVTKVAVFTAASETFSQRNTRASIAETLQRFKPVLEAAQARLLSVRGYISCVAGCPFEGPIAPGAVASLAARLLALGCDEIDLGDTIGAGTPESIGAMLRAVIKEIDGLAANRLGHPRLTLHLHDTFGRAGDCVRAALDLGLRSFDGSAAGLGGCPYASTPAARAPGNIATETLVRVVHDAGFATGVDLDLLRRAASHARTIVSLAPRPKAPA